MPQLPNGRGLRAGEDSFVNQQEAFAQRRGQIPLIRGGVIGPQSSDFMVFEPVSTLAYAIDTLYIIPLTTLSRDSVISEARFRVNTLGASSTLDIALYRQDEVARDKLLRIPQTEVRFDCTSAGLKSEAVPNQTLKTGSLLFMVCLWNNVAATVTSAGLTVSPVIPVKKFAVSAGSSLPNSLLISDTVDETALTAYPMVVYLSREYAEFL